MVILTLGAAVGWLPWIAMDAHYGSTEITGAGALLQSGLTALAITLAFFLPAQGRIMRLEHSHRTFSTSMDDIVRAYRISHETDRANVFKIGSEFDSVRERIKHLREHPDLGHLEPEILELAAQMSHTSRDIAEVYSQEKVDRAKLFLRQRQQEIEHFLENLALAKKTIADLKHWMLQIETEEGLVDSQITALEHDLLELLPQLGFDLEGGTDSPLPPETVIPMRQAQRPKSPSLPDA